MSGIRERFLKRLRSIIIKYTRAATEQVRAEWMKYDDDDVEGEANISFTLEETESKTVSIINAFGQKAWILEYGSGSELEDDPKVNPFLKEYVDGIVTSGAGVSLWNPMRSKENFKIVSRPAGEYYDLDDWMYEGRGVGGFNLENTKWGEERNIPFKPRYIIRKILFGEENDYNGGLVREMNEEIKELVAETIFGILKKFPKKIVIAER